MLRIVILLDSLKVSAWVWEAIFQTMQEKNARVVLAVVNQSPKSSGKKSPFLYRLYRALDRKVFLREPDAFSQKDLSSIPGWDIPVLPAQPIQKKYSDYLMRETLEEIRACNPDIIIRFGFRILKGEILQVPKFGVWSFHHGDPASYRGGPPGFWEVMTQQETTGTVLQRLNEKLDQGDVLYESWSQTDPLSVQRNANRIFWKSSFFVSRVLVEMEQKGKENWLKEIEDNDTKSRFNSQLLRPPGNLEMISLALGLISRNFLRKVNESRRQAHWEIGFAEGINPGNINQAEIKILSLPDSSIAYLADPFPVSDSGKQYVFAEQYDKEKKKGSIVCTRVEADGLKDHQLVLEEDWHLSYPFVFQEKETWYMVPESAEAGKLYLYKARKFPFQWGRLGVFYEGEGYDPTIYKADGKFWLFINEKAHPEVSSFDELNLYWTETLEKSVWNAHPMNPIVSDVRNSRPAGKLFREGNKLFRPAQDSGKRYGHRIAVQEVICLSETDYQERTAYYIEPKLLKSAMGVHTVNFCEDRIFLDFYFRK